MGEDMFTFGGVAIGILAFFFLMLILGSFFTVSTAQVAVITRFGRFLRAAQPGLNWKWPFIDTVAGRVSLRVNQINLTMETKTKETCSSPFISCKKVQRVRHHSHFRAKPGSAGEGL